MSWSVPVELLPFTGAAALGQSGVGWPRPTTTRVVVVVSVVISLGIITIAWARGRISTTIQDEATQWILVWGHGSRAVKLTIPQRRRLLH